jgi:hypothetical protein
MIIDLHFTLLFSLLGSVAGSQDSALLSAAATVTINRGVLKFCQARMMDHPGLRRGASKVSSGYGKTVTH